MKNKGVNEKLKYVIPLLVFILIFSFALACGVEPPREEVSKPTEEEEPEKETAEVVKDIEENGETEYRETELGRKVPKVEWKIGEPIDFPNGLRLTLNKVWMEKQLDYTFVVISVMLENTTDEIQDGIDLEMPTFFSKVWDSDDNRFSGSGGLTVGESIWSKIDSLSPGENKKWPPGVKLTGNIYFDVSGNTGGLMIELEYSEFLRTNVIYCYKLEDIKE